MYICICNGVTDQDIRNAVDSGARNIKDLQKNLGVASCCGQCACEAKSVLNDHKNGAADDADFLPSLA